MHSAVEEAGQECTVLWRGWGMERMYLLAFDTFSRLLLMFSITSSLSWSWLDKQSTKAISSLPNGTTEFEMGFKHSFKSCISYFCSQSLCVPTTTIVGLWPLGSWKVFRECFKISLCVRYESQGLPMGPNGAKYSTLGLWCRLSDNLNTNTWHN